MDRIYFFRLAKEEKGVFWELPIFRMETDLHEVYYLQLHKDTKNEELSDAQTYMEKGIRRIAGWYGDEENHNAYMMYDAAFEKWLRIRQKEAFWQKRWNLPMYQEYEEACNLLFLLRQPSLHSLPRSLIVLGEAIDIEVWLGQIVRHMKGLTFFSLIRPKAFEKLRDQLNEEFGLLADWKKSLHPESKERALILDYCGKEKVYIWGIPRGSVWIDMTSMEVRRHALKDRDTGIRYISLKSFWQEEMLQTLDTVSKIKYNT